MSLWRRIATGERSSDSSRSNHRAGHTHQSRWTQGDQDQNNHALPHCCGVCQDSPIGDVGQGLL